MALNQQCDVDGTVCSNFLTPIDDNTITRSLYNANGQCGNIGVSVTGDRITKCDFLVPTKYQLVPEPFDFFTGANVVDIDVICFANGRYGIVAAMNSQACGGDAERGEADGFTTKKEKAAREEATAERPFNSVSLFVQNRVGEFKLFRTIKVYNEITCMRVLISPPDMPSQQPFLSARIGTWPNLVAIGCQKSTCYISQFAAFDPAREEHWNSEVLVVSASTDALKALSDERGRFTARFGHSQIEWNRNDVWVTAVAYIPCYGALLIGLSNGCIVMVPLDGKSCITCLTVPVVSPVRFLVVLEPEYDPQGGFYVFSARDRVQQRNRSPLMIYSHKIGRQSDGGDGYEYQDMGAVVIPMLDGDYWLNVHGMVKKRRRREADAGNDTTSDASHLPEGLNTTQNMQSDGMERVHLFYSYITLKGELKGGIFDLNAYYSRRCGISQVKFDEFGQNDICSQFTMTLPQRADGSPLFRIKDISGVHCESLCHYATPIFDRDVLFQPAAAALSLHIYTFGKHAYKGSVDSLQGTALDKIAYSLGASLSQPDLAIAWLQRTGLVNAPATKRERLRMEERPANERVPTELDKIMRALVADEYTRVYIIRFIEKNTDRKQLLYIGRWMFNELRDIVARLDESIAPVFEDAVAPNALSKDAKCLIDYCPAFFKFAEQVFWKVRDRSKEMAFDTPRLFWVRKMHALMAFDLRFFLAAVNWFNQRLPMHEYWPQELLEAVAELNEQRSDQAKTQNHPLFLEALLSRLHEKTMDDALWTGVENPRLWYPPTRFNLLSLLRISDASLEDRSALALYLLMDVDEVVRREAEKQAEERRAFPVPTEGVLRSFIISGPGQLMADTSKSCAAVKERWESDLKGAVQKENEGEQAPKKATNLTVEETAELEKLIETGKRFRRLQKVDEDRMKVLCNKMGYGDYRFNLYLIKKARYPEVEDLPVPAPGEGFPNKAVQEYAKYKELALYQKSQLPPPTYSNAFACPYVLTKVAAKPQTPVSVARAVRVDNITIRGKTPKKLGVFRRVTDAPTASEAGVSTPTSKADEETARINALMKTPSMGFRKQQEEEEEDGEMDSDVAPDEMARVREALRTPRSRAAHSARPAAGEATPDEAPRPAMIAPTSILKSANKESRLGVMTPKSRLRFASVFEEKSISPRERDNSASTVSMSQPNFDDSYEDDGEHVLNKSTASHSADAMSTTTRLEKEIEEEEQMAMHHTGRRDEAEESHESSMVSGSGDVLPISSSAGEDEEEDEMTGGSEERMAGEKADATEPFNVYHDSNLDVSSRDDSREAVFVEQEEAAAGDAVAAEEEENVSRAETPEDEEAEEKRPEEVSEDVEKEKEEELADEPNLSRASTPVDGEEEEKMEEEPVEAPAAAQPAAPFLLSPPTATSTPLYPLLPGGDATFTIEPHSTTPTAISAPAALYPSLATLKSAAPTPVVHEEEEEGEHAAAAPSTPVNATFTVVESVFTVDVREEVAEVVEQGNAASSGEEEEEEAPAAEKEPVEVAAAAIEAEDEEPAATAAPVAHDAPAEEKEEEEEADEPNLSRASTPVDGQDEEEATAGDDAVAADDAVEEEEEENVSRATTPVDDAEEKDGEEDQVEQEPEVVVEEEEEEKEDEEEVADPASLAVSRPPVPKRRTVFANRAEPISLGLRSYIYMEDGIEKSYEEQRESSEDEEEEEKGEKAKEILARLSPRRSSSRLQGGGGGGETAAASAAAASSSSSRKRAASSRARKDSEEESAGPSTSTRSPRGKRERREEQEDEERKEGEAGEEHLYTTTRTRVIEERYVTREDGVLQHTVKQSTKLTEMTDGEVVKEEHEDKETIEEEGDREEMLDEADRVTPPMIEAAAVPTTERKSSRKPMPAPRTRTVSTASKASSQAKKKDDEEKKKREEKETTPLRTPTKSASRRKLMNDDEEEEENKKTEEPLTPRRSTRVRKPSESASVVSSVISATTVTPTKSVRRSSRAPKTPSREPSAAPVSPTRRLVLDDTVVQEAEEEKKKKKEAAARERVEKATPAKPAPPGTPKRGRPRKQPVEEDATAAAAAAEVVPVKRRTIAAGAPLVGSAARKRATSESVAPKKKQEKEEEEEELGVMAELRKKRAEAAAQKAGASASKEQFKKELAAIDAKREKAEKRKQQKLHKSQLLPVIDEDAVATTTTEKKRSEQGEDEEQPSTSKAPPRRKRSMSEADVTGKKDEPLKTPAKKKARAGEKDESEDGGAGDQSMLRRSSRKAAATANEGLKTPAKTPSKSARGKQ